MTVQPTRDQLRALADKATPGPWEARECLPARPRDFAVVLPDEGRDLPAAYVTDWCVTGPDAAFIAAARTAVPQLLDQLDAMETRIRDLTQEAKDERGAALDLIEQVRIRDARIKAVRDVHHKETRDGIEVCEHCDLLGDRLYSGGIWPCDTIRALDA